MRNGLATGALTGVANRREFAGSRGRSRCNWCSALLRLDAGGDDYRPPSFDFGGLEAGKGIRGLMIARWNLLAQVVQPALDSLIGQRINNSRVEFRDDLLRGPLRRPHAGPDRDVESWQSRLIHRGDVGRGGEAHFGGDGVRLDVAVAHMRQGVRRLIEHQVDVPAYQVLHGRGRAAVLRESKRRASGTLEVRPTDM